jgi:hypothetical protein
MFERDPHIYALADAAYRTMKRRNQDTCIVISGKAVWARGANVLRVCYNLGIPLSSGQIICSRFHLCCALSLLTLPLIFFPLPFAR